jgi:hypothetical protein
MKYPTWQDFAAKDKLWFFRQLITLIVKLYLLQLLPVVFSLRDIHPWRLECLLQTQIVFMVTEMQIRFYTSSFLERKWTSLMNMYPEKIA